MNTETYLKQAQSLLDSGQRTDGCTMPFKTYVHRWLAKSKLFCAAHDFGSLGLIAGVSPGWHNNWMTFLAHISQPNPVYWVFGLLVSVVTLPWVVWRRNFGITILDITAFHVILLILIALPFLIYYQPVR